MSNVLLPGYIMITKFKCKEISEHGGLIIIISFLNKYHNARMCVFEIVQTPLIYVCFLTLGEPGSVGVRGLVGPEGSPGPQGRAGTTGDKGVQGLSGKYCIIFNVIVSDLYHVD